jgi:transporter family-2 protein
MNLFVGLAFLAGACIAIQAAMNAQLGQIFHNSLLATSYAFFTSFVLVTAIILYCSVTEHVITQPLKVEHSTVDKSAVEQDISKHRMITWPLSKDIKQVPWYLWFSFVFSVIGVGSFYFLIPKMGVGSVMSYALTGQIIVAMLISHFGLFDSPTKMLSLSKLFGTLLLVLGIILINRE